MWRGSSALITILTAGMLLVANAAEAAQSRAAAPKKRERQPEELAEMREATLAQIDVWLRRLSGRFRAAADTPSESIMDCQAVGPGPGIHCIIGPIRGAEKPYPTVMLFGITTDGPGVRYLQVNASSVAFTGLGRIAGDTVIFPKVSCPLSTNRQARISIIRCERTMRIHAPPNGRYFSIMHAVDLTVKIGRAPIQTIRFDTQSFNQRITDSRKPAR